MIALQKSKLRSGRTTVPIKLEPWGTVFVVFRKQTRALSRELPTTEDTQLTTLQGSWNVSFPSNWGASSFVRLNELSSWTKSQDSGVKYFSGTGTYTKTIYMPEAWFRPGEHLLVDLGEVKDLAEVYINERNLGVLWHAPFRVDATIALKPGINTIVVRVTNTWVNRLIGDQKPGAVHYIFTDVKPYDADSPLLPSGLLGPVTIIKRKYDN